MSEKKIVDDGGPAFPLPEIISIRTAEEKGMTLRDWFAGTVGVGELSLKHSDSETMPWHEILARAKYDYADSMLKIRRESNGGD